MLHFVAISYLQLRNYRRQAAHDHHLSCQSAFLSADWVCEAVTAEAAGHVSVKLTAEDGETIGLSESKRRAKSPQIADGGGKIRLSRPGLSCG